MTPEVFEPCDPASLAAKLKWANGEGLAIAIRGAGTKQTWGAASSRTDVVLSTLGLNAPIDHVAGDLVATVPAGAALHAVNDVLRRERVKVELGSNGDADRTARHGQCHVHKTTCRCYGDRCGLAGT